MLLVQQYLQSHTFAELAKEHGVYASLSKSGHKWSLNYDQIEARESDPLSQECRGLILARHDGSIIRSEDKDQTVPGRTVILAYPMKRFFNYGQGSAAEVNWTDPNLAVLEKLDGTLCIVYYDQFTEQWCVATRSVPEADLLMDGGLFTFRTLFQKALEETTKSLSWEQFAHLLNKNLTYCFELTTPYNRIVVQYTDCRITLLAVRKLSNLQELDPLSVQIDPMIPVVQGHTYTRVDELLDWVSSLNPMEHEGVVVRDSNFNRIKVKNAAYVAYNKVRERLATSPRNCLEIILLEKEDDVLPLLPEEYATNLHTIKTNLQRVIRRYDELYQQAVQQTYACSLCGGITDNTDNGTKCRQCGFTNIDLKKTFALIVAKNKGIWSSPFFHMFAGKSSSMKDFILKSKRDGTWADSFLDKILELSNSTDI